MNKTGLIRCCLHLHSIHKFLLSSYCVSATVLNRKFTIGNAIFFSEKFTQISKLPLCNQKLWRQIIADDGGMNHSRRCLWWGSVRPSGKKLLINPEFPRLPLLLPGYHHSAGNNNASTITNWAQHECVPISEAEATTEWQTCESYQKLTCLFWSEKDHTA